MSRTTSKTSKSSPHGTIEVVQTRVVGTIDIDPTSRERTIDILAKIAMDDAAESMRADATSKSTYSMTDDLGLTEITIEHRPSGLNELMSVEEARAALAAARRRQADNERQQSVADTAVDSTDWQ